MVGDQVEIPAAVRLVRFARVAAGGTQIMFCSERRRRTWPAAVDGDVGVGRWTASLPRYSGSSLVWMGVIRLIECRLRPSPFRDCS